MNTHPPLELDGHEGEEGKQGQNRDRIGKAREPTQMGLMRRSHFQLRMDMLRAVKERAEGPTQIMYKANMSWNTLQQHLKALITNGCLRWVEIGNRKKYELTSKGTGIMNSYVTLLDEVSGHARARLEPWATNL